MRVDVSANRAAQKWSRKEILGRILWTLFGVLFTFSPRPLWFWRNAMLRVFGAKVGKNVRFHPSARITIPWNLEVGDDVGIGDRANLYALGKIKIDNRATISQGAHLCAGSHDHLDPKMTLRKDPINIGEDAWVCAEAFIGPGVSVGDRAIVGARAVVTKTVSVDAIVVGNPANTVGTRELGLQ